MISIFLRLRKKGRTDITTNWLTTNAEKLCFFSILQYTLLKILLGLVVSCREHSNRKLTLKLYKKLMLMLSFFNQMPLFRLAVSDIFKSNQSTFKVFLSELKVFRKETFFS